VEPGEAAVQALRGRWKQAQERFGAVEAPLIPMPSPTDVALLINGWRLSPKGPFGARPMDYVEAFAIGAGSNLGLEGVQTLFTGK
jgi:hypothetical protein